MKKILIGIFLLLVTVLVAVKISYAQDKGPKTKKAGAETAMDCATKCSTATASSCSEMKAEKPAVKTCDPAKCKEMGCDPAKCKEGKCDKATCKAHTAAAGCEMKVKAAACCTSAK